MPPIPAEQSSPFPVAEPTAGEVDDAAPRLISIADNVPRGPPAAAADDQFLPASRVWNRYGVTSMSLHRWLRDERLNFPRPIYIGRFRFWRLADLVAWESERAATLEKAG